MRVKATVSYLGTDFVGWQIQKNGLSVQEVFETALFKTFGTKIDSVASGRTDSGVHALGQIVHFDADTSIPAQKIPFAINANLPRSVSVVDCVIADPDFNARFSAKRKTYCYNFYVSNVVLPLLETQHTHLLQALDIDAMKKASEILTGEHDFKCFEASGSVVKRTVRTIYSIEIDTQHFDINSSIAKKVDDDKFFNGTVSISVTGNGFLYNMVRIIAGTLYFVGIHKLSLQDVQDMLTKKDRTLAGKTMPPQGLVLKCVEY